MRCVDFEEVGFYGCFSRQYRQQNVEVDRPVFATQGWIGRSIYLDEVFDFRMILQHLPKLFYPSIPQWASLLAML